MDMLSKGYPAPGFGLKSHAKRMHELGTRVVSIRGNLYEYVKANEALTHGDVITAVAKGAWDSGILADGAIAVADNATKIHVDTITTAKADSFYSGSFLSQATTTAKGREYKIRSHQDFLASGEADVYLYDVIDEVFADNVALLIFNPHIVEQIDGVAEVVKGVAAHDITSGEYGWVQVGGHIPRIKAGHSTSAAIVINEPLVPIGSGNAAAVMGFAASTPNEAEILTMGATPLWSLQAVAANTTGFVSGFMRM
jgi:hypothetical protein